MKKRLSVLGACEGGSNPCQLKECRYHLLHREPEWQVKTDSEKRRKAKGITETCSLVVAKDGIHSTNEIADYLGVSPEAVQAIENSVLRKLRFRDFFRQWRN